MHHPLSMLRMLTACPHLQTHQNRIHLRMHDPRNGTNQGERSPKSFAIKNEELIPHRQATCSTPLSTFGGA
jgi:hypothetical protein